MIERFGYSFPGHALVTASAAAVVAAASGYFLICRGYVRRPCAAQHRLRRRRGGRAPGYRAGLRALSLSPCCGRVAMGLLGADIRERDVTGVVMTFALGLGLLFLTLYSGYAHESTGFCSGASSASARRPPG